MKHHTITVTVAGKTIFYEQEISFGNGNMSFRELSKQLVGDCTITLRGENREILKRLNPKDFCGAVGVNAIAKVLEERMGAPEYREAHFAEAKSIVAKFESPDNIKPLLLIIGEALIENMDTDEFESGCWDDAKKIMDNIIDVTANF